MPTAFASLTQNETERPIIALVPERPRWSCVGWQSRQGTTEEHGGSGKVIFCHWFVKLFLDAETGRVVAGAQEHGFSRTATASARDLKAEAWWSGRSDFDLDLELCYRSPRRIR